MNSGQATPDWRALTASAAELLQQGQHQAALERLQAAERLAPEEREVRYWLGNACRMTGQPGQARRIFRGLLDERPGDLETSIALAFLLRDTGALADAAEVLLRAARQPGLDVEQLLKIAGFLREINQFQGAIEICEQAAALQPERVDLQFKLARLYLGSGDFEQSLARFRDIVETAPETGPAWILLAQQRRFESPEDEDFRRIQAAARRPLGREAEMCLAFAHGKALDDLGRWQEAWQCYAQGKRLMADKLPWNRKAWADFVERSLARQATHVEGLREAGRDAVFIVGMPRSGTTLLEQMLSRHPQIHGRGELNFLAQFAEERANSGTLGSGHFRAFGDTLWTQLRRGGEEADAYIDKNPLNFRHLDLLFDSLPSARVVHLERDGRASALSCFFQLFSHRDMAFSYVLDDLVLFYSGYRRLMVHWERSFPGRILRIPYDGLVGRPETTLREVLKFLGREWDEAMMEDTSSDGPIRSASVWQARQPVHTGSVSRWTHYRSSAPEFFERLAALDQRFPFG